MNKSKTGKVRDINEIDFENEKPSFGYSADFTMAFALRTNRRVTALWGW